MSLSQHSSVHGEFYDVIIFIIIISLHFLSTSQFYLDLIYKIPSELWVHNTVSLYICYFSNFLSLLTQIMNCVYKYIPVTLNISTECHVLTHTTHVYILLSLVKSICKSTVRIVNRIREHDRNE